MRNSWTDERLDDFREDVGRRFDEVDRRFDRAEADVKALRLEMGTEFTAVRREMKAGFDGLHRLMLQLSGVFMAAMIGLIATQL